MHLSIILPAKNEAAGLRKVLPGLRRYFRTPRSSWWTMGRLMKLQQ